MSSALRNVTDSQATSLSLVVWMQVSSHEVSATPSCSIVSIVLRCSDSDDSDEEDLSDDE
jgi:hypothetical protein